ncbi:alpha/beta hydrolase [Actinacidiphila bryophytorum]|uniref:Tripeptidyl aminopeptidase n=1 Tax=Actinacidiphila bryophytorum TaxID=1436133 RepID=A0A9W4H8S2_9ACTN|nr:alpha/beta hydrolase [Actinacidiphila bryophytorum]MBM9440214.1 alpha/beta fold hydrolase [Actinacidiphila bryophytorum]MBN6542526.1 alpha/beta fold hydrolase [Actinacidiphila bryophytorum]CAG7658316.1 Tripeptidyl aminopeptidase [Actinacidiphila bryophytorum]
MRRTIVLVSTGALIAGAVAAAPAATAGAAPAYRPPAVTVPESVGVTIAALNARRTGIQWADCPADWGLAAPVQCGWVTVPVDYRKPYGATIKLAVDRAASTGTAEERQGALVYNPGGPGGSGLRFPVRSATAAPLWTKTAKAYDFIGFDPRGVGHSAPISCEDPQAYVSAPKADPVPDSDADKQAQRKLAAEYAQGCLERTGAAMLSQMTTPNTARDLDVIRAALHEDRLNYLGVSYGTYLGSVYATLFPTHVRRMIIDSVVDPSRDQVWYQNNLDQDVAFQGRWADWEAWVAKYDSVYHLGSTVAQVQAKWEALRAATKAHPIGGVVGPNELLNFFTNAPYYDSTWATVASVWSQYAAGDTQAMVDAAGPDMSDTAGNITAENGTAVYTAVECTDAKWPTSWHRWDRDNTALNATYPLLTWSNAWMNLPCATWPVHQQTPVDVRSHHGLPGVLIVQSTNDAATPYPGALEAHRRLAGSRLITEQGAGSHGVTNLVNPCINSRVDDYLLHGTLDRHDVVCTPHATPVP